MSKITTFGTPTVHAKYDIGQDEYLSCHVKQDVTTTYKGAVGPFVKSVARIIESARYAFVPIYKDWDEAKTSEVIGKGRILRILGLSVASVLQNDSVPVGDVDPDSDLANEAKEESASMQSWHARLTAKAEAGDVAAQERLLKFEENLLVKDKDGNVVLHKEYNVPLYRRLVFMSDIHEDVDHSDRDFTATLTSDDDIAAVTTAAPAEVVNA